MNIYCKPQEIFLQVSKAFKTLENQWMNADAMLQAIHRVTVKKAFCECAFEQNTQRILDTNTQHSNCFKVV